VNWFFCISGSEPVLLHHGSPIDSIANSFLDYISIFYFQMGNHMLFSSVPADQCFKHGLVPDEKGMASCVDTIDEPI
jgi:hypothetical protein